MRISDWSSDVCSSDLSDERQCLGLDRARASLAARALALRLQAPPRTRLVGDDGLEGPVRQISDAGDAQAAIRSEEHTSELQSLMRISYAVFCLKKKNILVSIYITKHHLCTLHILQHIYR